MKSKECDQSEESEERNQSMEHAIIPNAGAGMDRLEMSFYEKIYVNGQHCQLLMMKQKYDTSKGIDTYMSLEHDVTFTQIPVKRPIKQFGEQAVADMFKE